MTTAQRRRRGLPLVVAALVARRLAARRHRAACASAPAAAGEWRHYGGDAGARKYSPLAQIAARQRCRVWQWRGSGRRPTTPSWPPIPRRGPGAYQDTPLMANGVLYTVTSLGQLAALDPGTGAPLWTFDPGSWKAGRPGNLGFVHRGTGLLDRRRARAPAASAPATRTSSPSTPRRARSTRRSATAAAST